MNYLDSPKSCRTRSESLSSTDSHSTDSSVNWRISFINDADFGPESIDYLIRQEVEKSGELSRSAYKARYHELLQDMVPQLTVLKRQEFAFWLLKNSDRHQLAEERHCFKSCFFSRSKDHSEQTKSMHQVLRLLLKDDPVFEVKKTVFTKQYIIHQKTIMHQKPERVVLRRHVR